MIGLLFIVAVCTGGLATCVFQLLRSYWRTEKRANQLRREARKAERLLAQAKEIHRLAPSGGTRLLVVLGEACRDMVAATRAEDWETALAFKHQIETIEALLAVHQSAPVTQPVITPAHQQLLEAAPWN
jgi:hypothetical protein